MARDSLLALIVEDEALVRMNLVDELEDAGFDVLEAANADEALTILHTHPEIEALITDVDMPGSMDGIMLAELVHQSCPDMTILVTSGYLKVPKSDLPAKISFMSKPYDVARIINHVRELTIR